MKNSGPGLIIIVLLLAAASGCGVRVAGDVPVEMRDGVNLMTDIYLPSGSGPFPVILTRLAYGTKSEYAFQPAIGYLGPSLGSAHRH